MTKPGLVVNELSDDAVVALKDLYEIVRGDANGVSDHLLPLSTGRQGGYTNEPGLINLYHHG